MKLQQSVGEWLGDAHSWARQGLDSFIEHKISEAKKLGVYRNVPGCDTSDPQYGIMAALLREHIYLIHAIFQSLGYDKEKGLDALRAATAMQRKGGRLPLIPTFRSIIAELLGVPDPHTAPAEEKHDAKDDKQVDQEEALCD